MCYILDDCLSNIFERLDDVVHMDKPDCVDTVVLSMSQPLSFVQTIHY